MGLALFWGVIFFGLLLIVALGIRDIIRVIRGDEL
jgi:hypothetical protein|tara:strand:- start:228 stop:332 length:105 start_codon:yes stop_codon:yes gene_type:complete